MNGMPEIDSNSPSGMTTKEWLQRIEGSLTRIEDKLDTKAEKAELSALNQRLQLIESLGTEQARRAEDNVRALTARYEGSYDVAMKAVTDLKVKVYSILGGVAILATVLEVLRQGGLFGS